VTSWHAITALPTNQPLATSAVVLGDPRHTIATFPGQYFNSLEFQDYGPRSTLPEVSWVWRRQLAKRC